MSYSKLHSNYFLQSLLVCLFACAIAGITAAITLALVPHENDKAIPYITIIVVTLLFIQIPFVINPIQKAYQDSIATGTDNTRYLDMMSKTNYFYILTTIPAVLVTIAQIKPDEAGFYSLTTSISIVVAYIFFAAITMVVQLSFLKHLKRV